MNIMDVAGNLPNTFSDALGLAANRSTSTELARTLGIVTAGICIGAGLALLLAPKAGAELRRDIEARFNELRKQLRTASDVTPTRQA